MLAWYGASSPEHGGTADLSLASNPQPPTSPAHHFGRPAMQSPGPPYQGSMGSAMNYSERPYENQMVSHCQTNSYPSYQPPSPYRPHPVSPPAHAHQYGAHSNHQMHSSLAYGAAHQLSPYGSSQAHYASLGTDLYGSRASMYTNSSRAMQQMKSSWGDSNGNSSTADLMQYGQPSPRPPMMPPPPIHSPSHSGMSSSVPPPPPPHYRQIPIVSPANHSPHSWSQSQIPSPGVLHPSHSPRTTPSPLPAHARSPSHSQPFSPPPSSAAPSPHQPPPSMTPHPPPQKTTPSPPSGSTTPAPGPANQSICNSPSTQSGTGNSSGNNDPLQSLQKMVMLDSETVESPITRANYEMAANQAAAAAAAAVAAAAAGPPAPSGGPPVGSNRPSSYFSVEQLAGSDPGSPYPTYYNLDQNRLCTPPRTCMSTPTSSTFSSAPDSTSSNSPRSDSRTTTASADSSNVGHVNGDIQQPPPPPQPPQPQSQEPSQPQPPPRRPDFPPFNVSDVRIPNGNHPTIESTVREENGPASSDSENKDAQDFLHHLGGNVPDIPPTDGTVDLSNTGRKSPKSPIDNRRAYTDDLHCDPSILDGPMDAIARSKPLLMPQDRRNSTLPEFEITNGKPENHLEDMYPSDAGYVPRPPRYYSPTARWNKMGPLEDGFMGMQNKAYQDDYMPMPKAKRGRKKKMFAEHEGLVSEWDIYNTEITHRPPRVSRGGARGRRGSRRRGGLNAFPPPNPEPNPMDMYSNDILSMRNHHPPTNGMGDMMGNGAPDKNMGWSSHNYHMGPPQSMTPDYCQKDNMSGIKPPMMDPHGMDTSSMNAGNMNSSQASAQNYQSDVPPVEGRGPLLFTVNKDGSTVKLQDGQMSNSNSSVQNLNQTQQYYDPVLGQMVQPAKKKRGRPFGSKNKPKPPGEERQPRRRRKKDIFFGPEGPPPPRPHHPKPRLINGPYVRISGIKSRALTVSVINVPPKDDDMEAKYMLQKRQLQQLGNRVRQKLGLGPSNSNSPLYEMVSKDKSWLCCLCCKNSHYRGLGDLFGPYFLNGEQRPSNMSAPPSPLPPPQQDPASSVSSYSYDQESNHPDFQSKEEDPDQEDSRESLSDSQRRFPGKKRSDVMEQMFRAALLRKAKQANVSLAGQKMCDGFQMNLYNSTNDFSNSLPPMYPGMPPQQQQPPPPQQLQPEPVEDIKGFWVHEDCAIWSKGVYLFTQKVYGLEETIIEAAETICSRCKFPGASLTCAWHKCTEHYHYMCARNKWCQMNEENYTIFCPKHRELDQK